MHQHAHQHRSHGREANSDQQRRSDSGRSTETGRPFDKATKQPGNDDRLNPRIRADGGKTGPNHGDATGVFKRIEQQDGAKDDPQQPQGNNQPLEG